MSQALSQSFQVACIFQCLLLVGFLLSGRRRRTPASVALAAVLGVLAVHLASNLALDLLVGSTPAVTRLKNLAMLLDGTLGLVYGPLFHGFLAAALLGRKFRAVDTVHLAPFAAICGCRAAGLIDAGPALVVVYVSLGSYLLLSSRLLWRPLDPTDRSRGIVPIKWLWLFVGGWAVAYILDVVPAVSPSLESAVRQGLSTALFASLLLWVSGFVFAGLAEPQLYLQPEGAPSAGPRQAAAPAPLPADEGALCVVERLIEDQRLHLRPQLTLSEVAEAAGLAPRRLSELINRGRSQTFLDWVNERRVEEAKRILRLPAAGKRTMLDVLEESGFNSKSTFNSVFKSKTGLSPRQYQEQAGPIPVRNSAAAEIRATGEARDN